jgi:hypothetical protein
LCSYLKVLNEFLSRVYNIYLKIKRFEMDSRSPKTLSKSYKYPLKKRVEKKGRKKEKKIGKYLKET